MPIDVVIDPKNPPSLEVSNAQLDDITALALSIAQAHAGVIENASMMAPYAEQPEKRKADMRARTLRTIQALVMLGWIEKP